MAKSQASSTRDPRDDPVKKPLPPLAPKPSNSSPAGSSEKSDKKAWRKKKKHRRLDQQRDQGRKDTSSTPTPGANSGTRKDMSQITCFNCNKKGHYLRNCSEPRKNVLKNQYRCRRPPLQWLTLVGRLPSSGSCAFDICYNSAKKNDEDKDKDVRALIDSGSEINIMHPAYATKLGLRARKIDVGAQKIDGSHLDTFGMVIADCSVKDKLGRVRFFQETFLLANIGLEVVLEMLFLTLSKADIRFAERELV